jgi:hypothetical protein
LPSIDAAQLARRALAQRVSDCLTRSDHLKTHLGELLERLAPGNNVGIRPWAGYRCRADDFDRRQTRWLISEAVFARVCGVAPIPAEDPLRTGAEGALESL